MLADHPLEVAEARSSAWLGAHGLLPSTSAAEQRSRLLRNAADIEEVRDVATAAATTALDLAAEASIDEDELYDESTLETARVANDVRRRDAQVALARLADGFGVGAEHLRALGNGTPGAFLELLPLLHEMCFARSVGASTAARRLLPPASSYGAQHSWPSGDGGTRPRVAADGPAALVLVPRLDESLGWLKRLPKGIEYHVMQRSGVLQPDLPESNQTALKPTADSFIGGSSAALPTASFAIVSYLIATLENEELIEELRDPEAAARRSLVVSHEREGADESVQGVIVAELRRKAQRVRGPPGLQPSFTDAHLGPLGLQPPCTGLLR